VTAIDSAAIRKLAQACGLELAGVARASPAPDFERYRNWVENGFAGEMRYLTDHRGALRGDARSLLPSARSVICVGKIYNTPLPYSTRFDESSRAWIARYAWGDDYHDAIRRGLERLDGMLREKGTGDRRSQESESNPHEHPYESRICVDTAPLLERSYARAAGLGWVGKNTCLINQQLGSWFFLGELVTSLEIAPDAPPPARCGTCTRCIDACPTAAIVPEGEGFTLDARRCISYFTIELRGAIPEQWRAGMGANVFGCDICQDVCPWNRRAAVTADPAYAPRDFAPPLDRLAQISEPEFRSMFRGSPVTRAKYSGFLRNVATAMGSLARPEFREPLDRLAQSADAMVAEHARWALARLGCAN
jgi:epoxyqueuosine reductase